MEVGPELAGTGQTATESNQEVDMDMEKASADEWVYGKLLETTGNGAIDMGNSIITSHVSDNRSSAAYTGSECG